METVNWFQAIPSKYRNTPFEISIHHEKTHGQEVKRGDTIAICESGNPSFNFVIKAQCNGYYCRTEEWKRHLKYDPKEHINFKDKCNSNKTSHEEFVRIWYGIGEICETLKEYSYKEYVFSYEVGVDTITNLRFIHMDWYCIAQNRHSSLKYLVSGHICDIRLQLKDDMPCLSFVTPTSFNLRKGDVVYFCDSNSSYLKLNVTTVPYSRNGNAVVDFKLTISDINSLYKNELVKIVIVHKNNERRHTIDNHWGGSAPGPSWSRVGLEPSQTTFKRYITSYKWALQKAGFIFEKEAQNIDVADVKFEPCFVYLMYDSTNGYHKIGISKTPEYRERTLQSEKPTIELVCAKEYPSRKIAEAIESALHKVYERERIRGEWFNLSKTDVMMIQKTLQ